MSHPVIIVDHLTKTYRAPERQAGLNAAVRSLFKPAYCGVEAVRDVSFSVGAGEMVGLIGPNGAGKTSMLKMLAGLLHPSSGQARVAGFIPWRRQPAFLRQVSMVLGNKSQMLWDIPPMDTFYVLGEIYGLPRPVMRRTLDELVEMLGMRDLLTRPVRNLSLGERMKCELVAGLLHAPSVLFLDEPTLGLDVSMQTRLRSFIAEYNRVHGASVILTSHYMADVVALCSRVILIHQGAVLYDGGLNELAQRLSPFKVIRLGMGDGAAPALLPDLPDGVENLGCEDGRLVLRVPRASAAAITASLLGRLSVTDLAVEDPPIEAVIDRVYRGGAL